MLKKISIGFVILMFILSTFFFVPQDKSYKVVTVNSPVEIELSSGKYIFADLKSFDSEFTEHNRILANNLRITEEEAFILGNLGKYWTKNILQGRKVSVLKNSDLSYGKYSYRTKFLYSGYCIKDGKPYSQKAFEKRLNEIRRTKYKVLDMDSQIVYAVEDEKVKTLKNYVVIRKFNVPKNFKQINLIQNTNLKSKPKQLLERGKIQIFFTDSTTKLKPDRACSSSICREILSNINSSEKSIDIAIYGYSKVPEIEKALKSALNRGVKIRLVYDVDSVGKNIYPDTNIITNLLAQNQSDKNSADSGNIMHNKFYIFDDKTTITGSANLSHTDMTGFNSNSMVVIHSGEIAKIYKQEFEQMYEGKFHSEKKSFGEKEVLLSDISAKIYFSPQDKSITNAVLPIIKNAKKYIYIPTFVLTEKRVTEALIEAKNRGVDVKIIIDALSASNKHSKHGFLRDNGILVKTENFAGKMHSKSMIVDDKYTIIGSMNFSNSGEKRNDENLMVINDSVIANFYKENLLYQWNRIDNKWLKFNARAEGKDSIGSCSDGIDNNYDGLVDMEDVACK